MGVVPFLQVKSQLPHQLVLAVGYIAPQLMQMALEQLIEFQMLLWGH